MGSTGHFLADLEALSSRNARSGHQQHATRQLIEHNSRFQAPRPFRSQLQMHPSSPVHNDDRDERVFYGEDDDLDDFDRELLSQPPSQDLWNTGKRSPDIPPKLGGSVFTPLNHSKGLMQGARNANLFSPRVLTNAEDLFTTSSEHPQSDSSPSTLVSSPTVCALQNQVTRSKRRNSFKEGTKLISTAAPKATILDLGHAPPLIQGIKLIRADTLPDRFRMIFPFPLFNAVQSKCFPIAAQTDDNLVLSAPTGSGKTAVMELAICQLIAACPNGNFKIVYQAPTKSLCAERYRDWGKKFGAMGLQCAELTGDTEFGHLKSVQSSSIVITTPEKWDSVTRKWKDNARLMEMVRLFLIDEVHILKESRGATLEAVVSRMKSVGSKLRFVALSATVPNSDDIALWLGKNSESPHLPAHREVFREEHRPVKLQKYVQGYPTSGNDFSFEHMLTNKIPGLIARYSMKKPVMVFCSTRKSATVMSKVLAELWSSTNAPSRLWHGPRTPIQVTDKELKKYVQAGVAFHHGGLDAADRRSIENGFLTGNIGIICCTSTLAVGVNLPCYLVIIKGTSGWSDCGYVEYSDLEIMQMLGRAGRPQFDSSACAVILTREDTVRRYEKMVSGQETLESCLHQNLIDHLNAEIALGTVHDVQSAKRWLAGTFMSVRMRKNPSHYKLNEEVHSNDENDLMERICEKDIELLQQYDLVSKQTPLKGTEFGDAMARYYIKFETMKLLMSLPPKAKVSEILSLLAQATEFRDVRLKSGEKSLFKEINKDNSIKFPIKVDIALPAHKVSLLMQAELGGVVFPTRNSFEKHKSQYKIDGSMVFSHINRLVRCLIDCQLKMGDSVSVLNALELHRSLAARVWDNSALQLKQLDGIGDVLVRKLAGAGINSIDILEATEASRIDLVLARNPPFGLNLLAQVSRFPSLRIAVREVSKERRRDRGVLMKFHVEIAFLNKQTPLQFRKIPVYVCVLVETSDGHVIDFRRISARKLEQRQEILLSTEVTKPTPNIICHVMCDEIAGTRRYAVLNLREIPISWFPPRQIGVSKTKDATPVPFSKKVEEFEDPDLDDGDFLAAERNARESTVVEDIDDIIDDSVDETSQNTSSLSRPSTMNSEGHKDDDNFVFKEPVQLENGRWTCQHPCKELKRPCNHKCCREGVAKPRKPPKRKQTHETDLHQLQVTNDKGNPSTKKPEIIAGKKRQNGDEPESSRRDARDLAKLPNTTGASASVIRNKGNDHNQGLERGDLLKALAAGANRNEINEINEKNQKNIKNGLPAAERSLVGLDSISDGFDDYELDSEMEVFDLTGDYQLNPNDEGINVKGAVDSKNNDDTTNHFGHLEAGAVSVPTAMEMLPRSSSGLSDTLKDIPPEFFDSDIDLGAPDPPFSNVNMEDLQILKPLESQPSPSKSTPTNNLGTWISKATGSKKRGQDEDFVFEEADFSIADEHFGPEERNSRCKRPKIQCDVVLSQIPSEETALIKNGNTPIVRSESPKVRITATQGVDTGNDPSEITQEEDQKRRWEGIDPMLYEMFKDCVELV